MLPFFSTEFYYALVILFVKRGDSIRIFTDIILYLTGN